MGNTLFRPPNAQQVQQTRNMLEALQPKNIIHEFNNQLIKPIIQEIGDTERTIVNETGKTVKTTVDVSMPIADDLFSGIGKAFGDALGGLSKGLGIDPNMIIIGGALIGGVVLISVLKK